MAFKLPNRPSPRPDLHELADFAELLALIHGRCSATEIQRYLGRIDDNDENVGIEDDDEENEKISDGMMVEIGFDVMHVRMGILFGRIPLALFWSIVRT